VRGRGVVVDEPSVVAVSKTTGEIVAIGREAQTMQGREARDAHRARLHGRGRPGGGHRRGRLG
jgi:actin-like ATPase involved in cell morphogenesis